MATEDLGSYLVLSEPQDVSRKTKILGCVISSHNSTNPFDDYVPYLENPEWEKDKSAGEELKKTLDFFWKPNRKEDGKGGKGGEGVKLQDILIREKDSNETEGHIQLTQLLQGHINRKTKKKSRIKAGNVQVHTIDNAGGAVRTRLSGCTPWMSELKTFYESDKRETPTYYIVTGVYTCSNVQVSYDEEQDSGKGGESKLPGDAVVAAASGVAAPPGMAQALDIGGELDKRKDKEKEQHATVDGEIILALRYHILDLEFKPAEEKGNWLTRRIRPTTSSAGKKRAIKSVSLGKPVRDGRMISVLGADDDSKGLFYYKEPVYAVPDDGTDAHEPERLPNGAAH